MKLPEIDFSDLDIKKIGSWPLVLRIAVIAASCVLAFVLGYYALIKGNIAKIDEQSKQNIDKRKEFKEKFNMASNLDAYEKQMIEVKETYKQMLKQLPTSNQLPELIEKISRLAENNRLSYQSIKPGEAKSVLGFYKELPLDLVVRGSYNGFGGFVSDIAKIPRIVTMHDFSIKRENVAKDQAKDAAVDKGGSLSMTIQLKTYWLSSERAPTKDGKDAADKTSGAKPVTGAGVKGKPAAAPTGANKAPARPGQPGANPVTPAAGKGAPAVPGAPATDGLEGVQ